MSTATIPSPMPATPLMTADEFLAHHIDDHFVELVNGRVMEIPMPGFEHGEVCMNAGSILREFVKKHGLGRVTGNDTFVKTGDASVRGADVFFTSYARLPKEQASPRGIGPSPDLVIEVRSPTDRLNRMIAKAVEYLDAGVAVVVLLFPETKSAAIHRPSAAPVTLAATDTLELPDILPGFSVPLSVFFE